MMRSSLCCTLVQRLRACSQALLLALEPLLTSVETARTLVQLSGASFVQRLLPSGRQSSTLSIVRSRVSVCPLLAIELVRLIKLLADSGAFAFELDLAQIARALCLHLAITLFLHVVQLRRQRTAHGSRCSSLIGSAALPSGQLTLVLPLSGFERRERMSQHRELRTLCLGCRRGRGHWRDCGWSGERTPPHEL